MLMIRRMIVSDCKHLINFNEGTDKNYLIQWSGGKAYQYPITVEQIINRLETLPNVIFFTIMKEDKIAGFAELSVCDEKDKIGLISRFILGKQYQGKGIGSEALKYMIDYVLLEIKMDKVSLLVFEDNISAIKCYEKAGFLTTNRYEGERNMRVMMWNKRN